MLRTYAVVAMPGFQRHVGWTVKAHSESAAYSLLRGHLGLRSLPAGTVMAVTAPEPVTKPEVASDGQS